MTKDQTIEKLTTTSETTEWIPSREYAALIIQKAQAARLLAGTAAAVEHVVGQGEGATVRVRIFPKRTAQGTFGTGISEGAELTATVSDPTHADVVIKKYGDRDDLTGESIFQTKGPLKAKLLEAMGRAAARLKDEGVWATLRDASAGSSQTLATAGDLTTNDDAAVKLMQLVDEMRAAKDVAPDVLLCGPDVINALARIKQQNALIGAGVELGPDGRATRFYGLRVVDLFSIPPRGSVTTASQVKAIVIDSSRAYAEATAAPYGMEVTFEEQRVAKTDKFEEVMWFWYGCKEVDTDGIGHLKNPA